MAVWSQPNLSYCSRSERLDAEFYQPDYLEVEQILKNGRSLRDLQTVIIHPAEIKRQYSNEGIRILLAQNIRNNEFDWSSERFMPEAVKSELANNKMLANDVAITRSGANFGQASFFNGEVEGLYACADCLIIRTHNYDGVVLSTFLNTKYGRLLVSRGAYGAAQPHIAPSYLYTLRVPILSPNEVETVRQLVLKSREEKRQADTLYAAAADILRLALGINKIHFPSNIAYDSDLSKVFHGRRWDSEFYKPKYHQVLDAVLKAPKVRVEKFIPVGRLFSYLTNGQTPLRHDLGMGDVLFLTAEHVSDFRLEFRTDKRILSRHHETELSRTALRNGDMLVTIKGKVGNCAVVEHCLQAANINQDVALIRLREGVHPYFLSAWFNSLMGKQLVQKHSTGGINPFLGLGNLSGMPFPLIAHKEEQRIGDLVQETVTKAYAAEQEAINLLEKAKHCVEESIVRETVA